MSIALAALTLGGAFGYVIGQTAALDAATDPHETLGMSVAARRSERRGHALRGPARLALALAVLWVHPGAATAQRTPLGPVLTRVGALDQPEAQVFGRISAALRGSDGELLVLDEQNRQLRLFGSDGQLLDALGREGSGPEEFGAGSLRMTQAADGRILVADSRNLRVTTIRLHGGRLSVEGSIRTPFVPLDVCAVGGRIFVYGAVGEALVREIDDDGTVLRAFAPREEPRGSLAAQLGDADHFLNHAFLGCDASGETVLLAHAFHPVIRAFSVDGVERWRVEHGDYDQQQFRRGPDGRCCAYLIPNPRTGAYHVAEDVITDGAGRILVTLRRSEEGARPDRYEVRVLDVASGTEVGRHDVPGVIRSAGGGQAVIEIREPYPRIEVRGW